MKMSDNKKIKETSKEVKTLTANTNIQYQTASEQIQINQPENTIDNMDPNTNTHTYNYIAQQTPNNIYNRGRGYNPRYPYTQGRGYDNYGYGNFRSRGYPRGPNRNQMNNYYPPCKICGDPQHWYKLCQSKPNGKEMRDHLKSLNLCDACITHKDMHGIKCVEIRYACRHCRSYEHETITCDGNSHPGS